MLSIEFFSGRKDLHPRRVPVSPRLRVPVSFHLVAALAALLLAAAVLAVPNNTVAMGPAQQPMIGLPAPPIDLKTFDGRHVALSELRSKIVVVHFAASW